MWDRILGDPNRVAREYTRLWNDHVGREREFYDIVRARFNRTRSPELLLYLLARCVKAAVRYN
ncbi:MAG TPA: DNA adenine methylase, partial [Acidimicrobiaceae bacterium]|nr:DNA adenine methylase [Acidimicrobiaceae bacterium]